MYTHVYTYTCIYVCIYIYAHTHAHIDIGMYTHVTTIAHMLARADALPLCVHRWGQQGS